VGVGKADTRVGRSFPVLDAFCVNIVQLMYRQCDSHYLFSQVGSTSVSISLSLSSLEHLQKEFITANMKTTGPGALILQLTACVVLALGGQASLLPSCKASPGSASWPSASAWKALNHTVSGRLIKPAPPGAVCHPKEVEYNKLVCPSVQSEWETIFFHVDNPISSAWNNFNNDSCLPIASDPCSGAGYPVYVVNATESAHVQAAVQFAGKYNVRLNVKGTGHDYLGRQDNLKSIYNIY
jgi:hypothetical protein